jgi:hypothetical protein
MIESPLYQEIVEEAERNGETRARRRAILKFLVRRFGPTDGATAARTGPTGVLCSPGSRA